MPIGAAPAVLELGPTLMVGLSESPGWRVSPGASQFHPTNTLEAFCCYTCYNSFRFYDNSMQEACISSELVMKKRFSCIKPWRKSCLYIREFDACSYGMCAHNLFITVRGNEVTGDVFA